MCKDHNHKWGRSGKSVRSLGTREEWECNNCMALKILFKTYIGSGNEYTENVVIAEPTLTT